MGSSLVNLLVEYLGKNFQLVSDEGRLSRLSPELRNCLFAHLLERDLVQQYDLSSMIALVVADRRYNAGASCSFGVSLDLSGCRTVTEKNVAQIAKAVPHLEELIFNGCDLTDSVVEAIVDHFPHLRALQLSYASRLSAAALQLISKRLGPQLSVLRLSMNRTGCMPSDGLRSLIMDCHHLTELSLDQFKTELNDDFVVVIANSQMTSSLRSLTLNAATTVTDASFRKMIENCNHLESIRLGMAIKMQGTCFNALSSHNSGSTLRSLHFNNSSLPSDTLLHIASVCSKLQTLGLANAPIPIEESVLRCLVNECKSLRDLSISVSSPGALSCFVDMPQLTSLYLSLCTTEEIRFSDESVLVLVQGCPNLQKLVLRDVSDNALAIISESLAHLYSLQLFVSTVYEEERAKIRILNRMERMLQRRAANKTTTVNVEGDKDGNQETKEEEQEEELSTLISGTAEEQRFKGLICTNLEVFGLNNSKISDVEFVACMRPFYHQSEPPRLQKLSLTNCSQIGDDSVQVIAHLFGKHLRKLSLYSCPKVTDKGIRFIGSSSFESLLESLDLRKCIHVTAKPLYGLCRRCRNLSSVLLPKSISAIDRKQLKQTFPRIKFGLSSQ
ncbi:GPI-anchored mannoprotein [Balamuthia mandrillaris]